jgi:hypothetical protein
VGSGGAGTAQRPSKPATRPDEAKRPAQPSKPGASDRPSQLPSKPGGSTERSSQLPSKPGGVSERPSQLPTKPGTGIAERPGTKPAQRPSKSDVGNFLGIAGGAAAGGAIGAAIGSRPSQLPAERPNVGQRPGAGERPMRPEQRADWSERSQNRNDQWQQRVDSRHDAWNQRADQRQQASNDFQQNRDERWNNLESAREDRLAWRDQNREDWQQHREDLWEYRGDRAEEIWDNARDFHDDVFDDRWWGTWGWGAGWVGHYPVNPWWWWAPAAFGTAAAFVDLVTPEPIYVDYGMNVVYEDDTVYVDNQPIPAEQYSQPVIDLAMNVEQPPPPLPPAAPPAQPQAATEHPAPSPAAPPAQAQAATEQPRASSVPQLAEEWLPLGVFALAQEEKGDAVMFFQISVNRQGVISGAYQSILTDDALPIAGRVDKASQRVAWRIGDKTETIFESSLGNLTQDVSPVLIHFGKERIQTWLLVRMPEPASAGQPQKLPEAPKAPPPLKTAGAN